MSAEETAAVETGCGGDTSGGVLRVRADTALVSEGAGVVGAEVFFEYCLKKSGGGGGALAGVLVPVRARGVCGDGADGFDMGLAADAAAAEIEGVMVCAGACVSLASSSVMFVLCVRAYAFDVDEAAADVGVCFGCAGVVIGVGACVSLMSSSTFTRCVLFATGLMIGKGLTICA